MDEMSQVMEKQDRRSVFWVENLIVKVQNNSNPSVGCASIKPTQTT